MRERMKNGKELKYQMHSVSKVTSFVRLLDFPLEHLAREKKGLGLGVLTSSLMKVLV